MNTTRAGAGKAALVAAVVATTLGATAGTAGAADAPGQLPVPYQFLTGGVAEITHPGTPLAGANDWSCKPTPEHPRPVVLVHGTFGAGGTNWATYGPLLHNAGYCVFSETYGALPGSSWPVSQLGGVVPVGRSVDQMAGFVDRVLAATGAQQVDLVGHSQGTLVSGVLAKRARPGKVGTVVSLAALWRGTGGDLVGQTLDTHPELRGVLGTSPLPSAADMVPGSPMITDLWSDGSPYAAGVHYTNIATRYDEAVWPYTSGLVPGPDVTNVIVQDGCPVDVAEHAALASDPRAADHVLAALDPAHAAQPVEARCVPVAPVHGAI